MGILSIIVLAAVITSSFAEVCTRLTSPLTYDLGNLTPYLVFKGAQPRITYRYGPIARIIISNYTSPAPEFQVANKTLVVNQPCNNPIASKSAQHYSPATASILALGATFLGMGRQGKQHLWSGGGLVMLLATSLGLYSAAAQTCSTDLQVVIELPGYSPAYAGGQCVPPPGSSMTSLSCDVAVLGGGIGGLHSAMRLAQAGKNVCLFEAANYFGGRLKGQQWATDPNHTYSDVGGIRVGQFHHQSKMLASQLNVSVEWRYYKNTMVTTRGVFAKSISTSGTPASATNIAAFPLLSAGIPAGTLAANNGLLSDVNQVENNMWGVIGGNTNMTVPRATILPSYAGYTSMQDYVRGTLGPEGLQFLAANFRFRADLTSNDILSYLQFNNEDYAANPNQYVGYPTGGLSQIARSAADAAVKAGAKLMLNNAVLDLSGSKAQGYCVTTRQNIVQANSVIVAIEPASFAKVTGNVASALQAQQSFKDAKPIQVVIIVQRYATRWWETAFDGSIRRAWTTDSCLNFVEAPVHTYGMGTQALRTVYADGQCALYWQNMQQADPTLGLMKNELQRHLSWLFNMSVPMALETVYQNWPSAWHFQHPNAARDIYGVEAWAQDPVPGENVSLVGEAWSPLRTWIQGALTSSVKALNTKYGLNLPIYSSSNDTFPDNGQSDPLNSRRL